RVHWFSKHSDKYVLQFLENDKKKPYLEEFELVGSNSPTIIHWGFTLTKGGCLRKVDENIIKSSPSMAHLTPDDPPKPRGQCGQKRKRDSDDSSDSDSDSE